MIVTLSYILLGIGCSFIILFFYLLLKQQNKASGIFSLICLAIAIYVIGYSFELKSDSIEEIKFFLKMEYFGQPFIFVFWFMFSYKLYTNKNTPLNLNVLIFAIPVLTHFLNVTNEYHHLYYTEISAVSYNGFIVAKLEKGPWYFIHAAYCYAMLIAGLWLFYKAWRKSPNAISLQSLIILFIGCSFPAGISIIYLAGLSPYGIDLIPFGMSFLAICLYISFFRYNFLDLDEIIGSIIFSEIQEGIIVVDNDNKLLNFNNSAQKIFEWVNEKNIGFDIASISNEAKKIFSNNDELFEVKIIKGNTHFFYEFHVTKLKKNKKDLGLVYLVRDISKETEAFMELDSIASYDFLTQVYNRRKFLEEAEIEVMMAKRHSSFLSILMLDIDNFKVVNDKYGHLAGDSVIKSIIDICCNSVRSTDIVGRYGGEEFVVLLSGASVENAYKIAENIRKHVEEMDIKYQENKISLTISIGVSSTDSNKVIEEKEFDINELLKKADIALYDAKNSGRNCVKIYM